MSTPKGIAIVGAHRASKLGAPYDDPAWQIWACSYKNENELPRQDVWFEMHGPDVLEPFAEYREFLAGLPCVYMQECDPAYPGSRAYPLPRMLKRFGGQFFRWSPCYMMALAIDREPERIGIWGIEADAVDGYGDQRLCLQHFIWVARSLGIKVTCPSYLDAHTPLYGYDN